MFCRKIKLIFRVLCLCWCPALVAQQRDIHPVTRNASPEARALLTFFYGISGKYLLSGQHNYPNVQGRNTVFASAYIGKTPVVYSTDWGFAAGGNYDSYRVRQEIVDEAIRQNNLGSIVTICWHAVPPTADEPVTFQPLPGADSTKLHSVQGRLLDQQFKDVLTPGTALYKHWCQQVDTIAVYLKKLQDAHVPVIWRPYHEMNGNWFWWGGRQGQYSTVRLYRQLFSRLVGYHKLNNLIWMWNVDRPSTPERKFTNFYVGDPFFDIASLDVYGSDFNQKYYDSLLLLANGKPIVLGEVGNPPTPEIIRSQPRWSYFVIWAGMVRNTTKKQYDALSGDSCVLFLDDSAYRKAIGPYRLVAKLAPLQWGGKKPVNFSGEWSFDEGASTLDNSGTGRIPVRLRVDQSGDSLNIQKTLVSEYSDNTISQESMALDGKEHLLKAPLSGNPRMVTAHLSADNDTLFIDTRETYSAGGAVRQTLAQETWTLSEKGTLLSVNQHFSSFDGKHSVTDVYIKK